MTDPGYNAGNGGYGVAGSPLQPNGYPPSAGQYPAFTSNHNHGTYPATGGPQYAPYGGGPSSGGQSGNGQAAHGGGGQGPLNPSQGGIDMTLMRGLEIPTHLRFPAEELHIMHKGGRAPNNLPIHHAYAWFSTLKSNPTSTEPVQRINPSIDVANEFYWFKREFNDTAWIPTTAFPDYQSTLPLLCY